MTGRLAVELDSVLHAAAVVASLADRVAQAPAGHALRRAADAVPGGHLAAAAASEAAEWSRESAALTTVVEELGRALRDAAAAYRRADEELAHGVPQVRSGR